MSSFINKKEEEYPVWINYFDNMMRLPIWSEKCMNLLL